MTYSPTVELACELIRKPSVTPADEGCLDLIAARLSAIGFRCEMLPFGEVSNLWAEYGEDDGPILVFAGHTDVVPTGPESHWQSHPFEPTIIDGLLTGRGASDMKGSLAAMVTACENYLADNQPSGRIGFLLTSDEEGPAINGTVKVVEWLKQNNKTMNWCIVGEPTSGNTLGDIIKNGRRGSINFVLTVLGQQGHIAYPQLADNPIHRAVPALTALTQELWDEGNDHFPATSFQISNINGGTGATNVIPGTVEVVANFRFSTEVTAEELKTRTEAILQQHGLDYDIVWTLSGNPFLTEVGNLTNAVSDAIKSVTGTDTELSTSGGTSDGRFIATLGTQVIELGPCNATIHKVNECVHIDELDGLSKIYQQTLVNLLNP